GAGERRGAHGIAVVERHGHHKDLFSPGGQYPNGPGANDGHLADIPEKPTAGHHAAAGDYLFGVHRARFTGGADQRQPERATDLRLREQFYSHANLHGPWCVNAFSLRREITRSFRGYRLRVIAGEGFVSGGYRKRGERAEPDFADR